MSVHWDINDHTGDVLRALEGKIPVALEACGLQAEGYAKLKCPVDTGNLRNSLTHTQEGDRTEVIGTNVSYAPYVELGTRRQSAQPYLKPAVADHVDEYRQIIEKHLSS